MRNFLLTCLFIVTSISYTIAQAGPGSIAFTFFNADGNDAFSFITLQEIPAGQMINFTENEWTGTAFNTGEGSLTWTNSSGASIPAGTVIDLTQISTQTPVVNIGSAVPSGAFLLSASGDQIYAYIGAASSPTFLTAILTNNGGFTGSNGTLTGTGLVLGETAVDVAASIGDGPDVAQFSGVVDCTGQTLTECASNYNTNTSWTGSTGGSQNSVTSTYDGSDATVPSTYGVLPVIIEFFVVRAEINSAILSWQTSQELNNSHFEIQHSTDNRTFATIGKEAGAGNSDLRVDYDFTHERPANGINYYRLQQFDFDGQSDYSQVVSVRFGKETGIAIYPNPVQTEVTIALDKEFVTNATAEIISQNGSTVLTETFTAKSFTQNINVNNLPAGIYVLRIVNGNEVYTERFVKK